MQIKRSEILPQNEPPKGSRIPDSLETWSGTNAPQSGFLGHGGNELKHYKIKPIFERKPFYSAVV